MSHFSYLVFFSCKSDETVFPKKKEIIEAVYASGFVMALSTKPECFYEELSIAFKKEFSGVAVVPMLLPASTDNSYYRSKGYSAFGLNPFILSPLQIESIHKSNEYIDIEDIEKGINVFEHFLNAVISDSLRVKQQ